MNKDDLEYLRDVLATDHQAKSQEPSAPDEIEAALRDFSMQAEVNVLAASEAQAGV